MGIKLIKNKPDKYYKIYSCKDGKWIKYEVEFENMIIPYIENVFEEDTVYRVIYHDINKDIGITTIFNRADLERFRSDLIHKQLKQDEILKESYQFIKKIWQGVYLKMNIQTIDNEIKNLKYNSKLVLGNFTIYFTKKFNWFNRIMLKLIFGLDIRNIDNE